MLLCVGHGSELTPLGHYTIQRTKLVCPNTFLARTICSKKSVGNPLHYLVQNLHWKCCFAVYQAIDQLIHYAVYHPLPHSIQTPQGGFREPRKGPQKTRSMGHICTSGSLSKARHPKLDLPLLPSQFVVARLLRLVKRLRRDTFRHTDHDNASQWVVTY